MTDPRNGQNSLEGYRSESKHQHFHTFPLQDRFCHGNMWTLFWFVISESVCIVLDLLSSLKVSLDQEETACLTYANIIHQVQTKGQGKMVKWWPDPSSTSSAPNLDGFNILDFLNFLNPLGFKMFIFFFKAYAKFSNVGSLKFLPSYPLCRSHHWSCWRHTSQ